MSRTAQAALGASALILTGCSSAGTGTEAQAVSVVATTTVWGDVTSQIVTCAGSGSVTTLMPIGADPHDYSPSSESVARIVAADLVVANGLGLEEGLQASLDSARADGAAILELAPLLDPIPFGEQGAGHADESEGGAEGGGDHAVSLDPHVWLDVARTATAAGLIGDALAEQTGDQRFAECGASLRDELTALDAEVAAALAAVPADMRILVTDHEAFGYLADAYGYTIAGTVVPGGSTLSAPSSAELAQLVATVRRTGVPAVFSNTSNPQALVEALASEVGDLKVVPLYEGSVGEPGSGAESYQGMMTVNATRISEALGG